MHRRDALQTLAALAGVPALAGRTVADVLAAAGPHRQAGRLAALNATQNATVVALAERIIPATDTPGATAAGVNQFIDLLLAEWFSADERRAFLDGIADVDARARAAFGKSFAAGTHAQQDGVVAVLDGEVTALREASRATAGHFFARFKALTLYGYYNSEVGMTQELRYQIIPGRYESCAPLGAR
ncbi:MAG: gluconate 2-dehydrogenase subunit 3 family protein [Gemmatimonadota bacterium]|nr:gluconate 2-dehydrogenase subunit 3 family protein [Gemmatimonadota bacterium]